jgi:hypothetical protein
MLHATTKKSTKAKKRQVRFPGIITDAKALGVHRVTLYRMFTGEWKLPGLSARYRKYKGGRS